MPRAETTIEGMQSGGPAGIPREMEAGVFQQPVEVAAKKTLAMKLETPFEMTLRQPKPEPSLGGIEMPTFTKKVKFGKLSEAETGEISIR